MPPKGTIYLSPCPRCTPDQPRPSAKGRPSGPIAKTDRAYGEVFSHIRNLALDGRSFSWRDLPFTPAQSKTALNWLARRGELRLARVEKYQAKADRRDNTIAHIRAFIAQHGTVSWRDLPFPRAKSHHVLGYLHRRGDIRILRVETYPTARRSKNQIRIYTKARITKAAPRQYTIRIFAKSL